MSKQSEAKRSQGYRPASAQQCANCKAFSSEISQVYRGWGPQTNTWTKESGMRCNLGGFAVTKTAICNCWAPPNGAEVLNISKRPQRREPMALELPPLPQYPAPALTALPPLCPYCGLQHAIHPTRYGPPQEPKP